jgi:hypothetical protein
MLRKISVVITTTWAAEIAQLLVGEGLQRRRVEDAAAMGQGAVDGVFTHQRLAAAGGGADHHRMALVERIDRLQLETIEREGEQLPEGRHGAGGVLLGHGPILWAGGPGAGARAGRGRRAARPGGACRERDSRLRGSHGRGPAGIKPGHAAAVPRSDGRPAARTRPWLFALPCRDAYWEEVSQAAGLPEAMEPIQAMGGLGMRCGNPAGRSAELLRRSAEAHG